MVIRPIQALGLTLALSSAACSYDWDVPKKDAGEDAAFGGEDGGASEDDGPSADAESTAREDAGVDAEPDGESTTHEDAGADAEVVDVLPPEACAASPCGDHERCVASDAGVGTCECEPGFQAGASGCEDIDECVSGASSCHVSATCVNTSGGFDCTCSVGYSGGGTDGIACAPRIAVGADHVCVVTSDDGVECWGGNANGQLGDGTFQASTSPVRVSGLSDVAVVAAGENASCALLKNRSVRCWGRSTSLQLGINGIADQPTPAPVVPGLVGVVAISQTFISNVCAIVQDGTVRCWGANGWGQLGNGSQGAASYTPTIVRGSGDAIAISSWGKACSVDRSGTLLCWGGTSASDAQPSPGAPYTWASHGVARAVAVSASAAVSCAIGPERLVGCWGLPALRGGAPGSSTTDPVTTVASPGRVRALSVGYYHGCVLDELSGAVWCWGVSRAPAALAGGDGVVSMNSNVNTFCALRSDGEPRCWDLQSTPTRTTTPNVRFW